MNNATIVGEYQVLKLQSPLTLGSNRIDELKIRPPKARDFKGVPMGKDGVLDFGMFIPLASRLTNEPPSTIEELSATDYLALVEILSNFLSSSKKVVA